VREPYRVAIALVREALGCDAAKRLSWSDVEPGRVARLVDVAHRPRLSHDTSSMGRLFDGVAALVLGLAFDGEEGRPAMLLEEACDTGAAGSYTFRVGDVDGEIDWRPVVAEVVEDRSRGVSPGAIAMRFHRAVADLVCTIAKTHEELPFVTCGGVFQNGVLGELTAERLTTRPAGWLRAIAVPPGDGGLALGQLAVAAALRLRAGGKE
jgi:hydrogenase maturation protein HypF